jgi:SAM-dependent methyltransferase
MIDQTKPAKTTSHQEAVSRFDLKDAAEKYAGALPGTATDRREGRCIQRMLAGVSAGAEVLDLPCGTGRLLPLLCGLGYRVTAADSSGHMVDLARAFAVNQGLTMDADRFLVADALSTPFSDGAFGAVVCNRLIHHFREPEVRRAALKELRRISRGPILVSFFRDLGTDALAFRLKHLLRGSKATDRIPISLAALRADIEAAGLKIVAARGVRPLVSRQWYVLLERMPAAKP